MILRNIKGKIFKLFVCGALVGLLTNCKASQHASNSNADYSPIAKEEIKTPQQRFKDIVDGIRDYNTINVGVKIELSKPTAFSFNGSVRFERGKSVYISLRKFGFEVAQLYLSNDSIIAVDKFNKKYLAESLTEITGAFNVGINDIQDLLLGRPFYPGKKLSEKDFSYEIQSETESWIAYPTKLPRQIEAGMLFSLTDNTLKALAVKSNETVFQTQYSQYYPTSSGDFASDDRVVFESKKFVADIVFKWSWTGAEFNNDSKQKAISIPKGYKRVDASALLKNLSN